MVGGYIAFAPNSAISFPAGAAATRVSCAAVRGSRPFFAVISLIIYGIDWPSVPCAVALMTIGSLVFGAVYKTYTGFRQALWYMVYIVFLTAMTYLGGVGSLSPFNIDVGSVIVVVVSLVVFLPWAIASRLPKLAAADMYTKHFVEPAGDPSNLVSIHSPRPGSPAGAGTMAPCFPHITRSRVPATPHLVPIAARRASESSVWRRGRQHPPGDP